MSIGGLPDDSPSLLAVAQLASGSGVLFAPRRVLTAAHCVRGDRAELRFRDARAWTRSFTGRVRRHPDFALPLWSDGRVAATRVDEVRADLAVIALDEDPALDGRPVAPIALAGRDDGLSVGARVSMVGYGDAAAGSSLAYIRRRGDARVTSLYDAHVAIEARDGAVATSGDSGGPLVIDRGDGDLVVVGVSSLFAEGEWSLFARVAAHRDWIATSTVPDKRCALTPRVETRGREGIS